MWIKDPGTDPGGAFAGGFTWTAGIDACLALNYAGYEDWRMPNIFELLSIVKWDVFNKCINLIYFPNTIATRYWSSTKAVNLSDSHWVHDFNTPTIEGKGDIFTYKVKPVRLGLPADA